MGKVAEERDLHKEIATGNTLRWIERARAQHKYATRHVQFWCDASDGVRLAGTMLGRTDVSTAVVVAHGFMGYRAKPKIRLLAEGLAADYGVFVFDLRGHGESGGLCTGGDAEALDVQAVVAAARERGYKNVVTVGASLGGIAVIREAALYRDVEGVIAISTPAVWGGTSKPVRRITWLFATKVGRKLVGYGGVQLADAWADPEPPVALAGRIAPIPLLLIHGEDDHYFPPESAEQIFAAAGEPKRLLILPGFGHAEDGFTPAFTERLGKEIGSMLADLTDRAEQ
ncbi:MAG: alpha/beta hydrolase [Actinomycetota bacterium]|nr:alpha/beta hydrolase [Actinomycetota bacterium]